MDRSRVEAVVVANLPGLVRQLGLYQWEITVGYSAKAADADGVLDRGECTRLIDYHSAHISLNPDAFTDAEGVLTTLRHELFHIVLAPFDLYTSTVQGIDLPEVAEEMLERVKDHAIERCVAGMERVWAGLSRN